MNRKMIFMAVPATLLASLLYFNNGRQSRNCQAACPHLSQASFITPDTLRKDPICGMMADDTRKDTVHYKNKVYAFCSKHCKEEFVKTPEAYLPKKGNK